MTNRRIRVLGGVLGVAGALWGQVAMGQASGDAVPALVFAFELRAQVGAPMEIGQVPHGRRRIVEILGGTVKGPAFSAKVLPGGADWQLIQPDGFSELDTRYTLETEQGQRVYVQNAGIRHAAPDVMQKLLAGADRRSEARVLPHGAEVRDRGARAPVARAQCLRRYRRALSDRGRRPLLPARVTSSERGRMDKKRGISRRSLLRDTAAAAAGGAALLAQTRAALGQPPAVVTRSRFRAWISRGDGPGRTTLQEAALRPITGRQVLVRTEATNLCYTLVPAVLGLAPPQPATGAQAPPAAPAAGGLAPPPSQRRTNDMAMIQGHGGVGVVEAVGPEVRRVQVGDRVCVSGTPHCGACYRCLRGRSDMCQFLSAIGPDDLVAIADLADGTPVYQNSHIGGLAEVMVAFEEWVVPIFTTKPAAEVGMVCGCTSVAGLGATTAHGLVAIEPASSVAIVGCGPIGLSAVQGARIAGATTIIAIDPIAARRRVALEVGATHALDPNAEGDGLVDKVRSLTTLADGPALGRRAQLRRPPPGLGRRLRHRSRRA